MTFVIGEPCIDILDKSCMDVCPVDCIYTGLRKNYINPAECINCSACVDACPVDAIYVDTTAGNDENKAAHIGDSRQFFEEVLQGTDGPVGPVGNPGGAGLRGDIGADTALVAAYPSRA